MPDQLEDTIIDLREIMSAEYIKAIMPLVDTMEPYSTRAIMDALRIIIRMRR